MKTLSRRVLLKGFGGATMGLPLLEIMEGRAARAQTAQKKMRYVAVFGGASMSSAVPPKTFGAGYELTMGLKPLGGRAEPPADGRPAYGWDSLRDSFNVVSNLRIPTSGPGAYRNSWHSAQIVPLLSGVSSIPGAASPDPIAVTSDWVFAKTLPATMRFNWLGYRVQPKTYRLNDNQPGSGIMSHDGKGRTAPIASPRAAYDQMFRDFSPRGAPVVGTGMADLTLNRNRSILDLISWNAARLDKRLGKADRARLDEHFTQVRELERRINQIPEVGATAGTSASCAKLPDPGADPESRMDFRQSDAKGFSLGYSNETERALVMTDLVYTALACDQARAIGLMLTWAVSFISVEPFLKNKQVDIHDLGHGGGNANDMARVIAWMLEPIARLADKLRRTREDDGNLLDRTVIAFFTEGGCAAPHSMERSLMVVGGGKAGGLVQGRHIDGAGRHHSNVMISCLQAAGVQTNTFGEISGRIPELHA